LIPDDASVSATLDLLVALSHREKLYAFAFDDRQEGGGYNYFDVDYILINRKSRHPSIDGESRLPGTRHIQQLERLIENNTFEIWAEEKNLLLLKRTALNVK